MTVNTRFSFVTSTGSPSGHVMVPTAVWYVMISELVMHVPSEGKLRSVKVCPHSWLLYCPIPTTPTIDTNVFILHLFFPIDIK